MVQRTGYRDGEPCWADVTAPDIEAATRFYGAVLDWTFVDTGAEFGHYTLCMKGDHKVAAITPPAPGQAGIPPTWSVYLACANVEEAARAIDAGGGKVVMGPIAIPGNGTMLYAFDPTGAGFGVWQGAEHIGFDLYNEVGAACWAEVNTRDGEAGDAFYRAVFGYSQEQLGDGETFDYTFWTVPGGDQPVVGRLRMGDEWGDIPPAWMLYYGVADADIAAERATAAGGTVQQGPFDSPYGRIAIVADPHGAVLSLIDTARRSEPAEAA
jgi:predicted enzyme related to lactoylglutathione lyase